MADSMWWHKPRLRTDEPGLHPRKVTWLELFYDLVFVIVIGQLSHKLAGDVSVSGFLQFVFLFIPTWWIWVAGTYYVEYWETNDISIRLILFLLMLPVVGLAVFIHDALDSTATGYALCYASARVILAAILLRAGYHDKISRTVAWSYATSFLVVAALIAASTLTHAALRIALWIVALGLELLTPILVRVSVVRLLPHRRQTSKLPERFGLFTIIVLGEMFVGVFQGLSDFREVTASIAAIGFLSLALVFALWSIYFDFIARRQVKEGTWWEFAWGYSHLALLMGIVIVGACLYHVVAAGEGALHLEVKRLLAGAAAGAMFAIALLESTLEIKHEQPSDVRLDVVIKVLVGLGALALGLTGDSIRASGLLALFLALALVPIAFGIRAWIRQQHHKAGVTMSSQPQ
jgi:low temperature requirement protein LtrA